ncbi:hypothetical protein [Sorangium sp. So ce204]|uniref:hypothetical protein n=1 Tax=Sorangium sp. So ce204 TaxID=3133288 RepID=UPI003F61C9A7
MDTRRNALQLLPQLARIFRYAAQSLARHPVLLALALLIPWSTARAETVEIAVPKAAVAAALNVALSSVRIHVDNYGDRHGTSWHEDSSYILLPDGSRRRFSIPEYTYKVTRFRQLKYYIDDFNTESIQASVTGNRMEIRIAFENHGEEIKARCVRRRLGRWNECTLDIERDIHMSNAFISVSAEPVAHKGSISIDNVAAEFKTDINIANRLCRVFRGVCGAIERKVRNELTNQIEELVRDSLSTQGARDAVANAVRRAASIRSYIDPAWKVTRVVSRGGNFVVTVERPD